MAEVEKKIIFIQNLAGVQFVNPEHCQHPKSELIPAYTIRKDRADRLVLEEHQLCGICRLIDPFAHATTLAQAGAKE